MNFNNNFRKLKNLETVKIPFVINEYAYVEKGELDEWLISDAEYMVSDAICGARVALVYMNGKLRMAYVNVAGQTAADISIMMRHFENKLPQIIKDEEYLVVVGNLTVHRSQRKKFLEELAKHSENKVFLLSDAIYEVLDSCIPSCLKYIQFFADNIIQDDHLSETTIFDMLEKYGFEVPEHSLKKGSELSEKAMVKLCGNKMMEAPYEIDGVLITKNHKDILDNDFIEGTNCPEYARICRDML